MTYTESQQCAYIFRQMCYGQKATDDDLDFLRGLLSRMDTPERTGAIAAIIRIMLGGK